MTSTHRGIAETAGTGPVAIAHLPRNPHPHYGRKITAVVVVLIVAFWVQGLARNERLDWHTVGHYLFADTVLHGILRTLLITIVSLAIAIVLGAILANMRLSPNWILRGISSLYVWFFRSIPLLVLLILWYNYSFVYAKLSVGVPFGPEFGSISTQDLITPITAAILAFGLHQAAYTSEIVRAALLSVPPGQREAAAALGMSRGRALRRIVFPQALRVAVPPIANEAINLVKSTALVAFIAVPDLLYSVQQIYAANFRVIPLLIVAALWYMLIVSIMSLGQYFLERRLSNASARALARRVQTVEVSG